MAVKRISSDIDVVTAARQRIKNVFSNGVPVYLSFSGGKDSIVLADLTYKLIQAGEINPSQLTVLFVDEEAIFDSIEATTKAWRKKFLLAGAKFQWWCIEVKHFSCLNELSSDETFVCWDRRKRDVWVRQPPPFAIRNHPQLRPRIDNYQSFLPRVTMDGIMITGVRAAESIQRLQYMAALNMGAKGITGTNTIYPIYDWKTADVWLYLRDQRIEVPEVYLQMYQVGVNRNQLRVSQFFSVDTVPVLVHLGEYDPSLMERVLRREPNAYDGVVYMGTLNFGGFKLNLISVDETYIDDSGAEQKYFPATSAMVTAPGCGHLMYGQITQIDYGSTEFASHAAIRVPKFSLNQEADIRKLRLGARPLAAPHNYCPYIYAAEVVS